MMDCKKSVTLSFDEVASIEEAAKLGGCSIQSILRAAAQSERLIYVAIRPHSSRLTANASHLNPRQGTQTTKSHTIVAMLPHYATSLAIAGNVDIAQYDAGFKPPHEWHCWELDAPQTISIDSVFVPRREAEAMRIFEAEKQQVNVDTGKIKPTAKSDTPRTRTTNLKRAITQAVTDIGYKPSFEVLWRYFQDDKDKSGFIEDFTDTKLTWRDTKGLMHDTEKETIRNYLSTIKS